MIFLSVIVDSNDFKRHKLLPLFARFTINLQEAPKGKTDISFHFDVRLCFGNNRNVVVRNTFAGGAWGIEERAASYFPFMPNVPFDLMLLTTPNSFKVSVFDVDGLRWLGHVMALFSFHIQCFHACTLVKA